MTVRTALPPPPRTPFHHVRSLYSSVFGDGGEAAGLFLFFAALWTFGALVGAVGWAMGSGFPYVADITRGGWTPANVVAGVGAVLMLLGAFYPALYAGFAVVLGVATAVLIGLLELVLIPERRRRRAQQDARERMRTSGAPHRSPDSILAAARDPLGFYAALGAPPDASRLLLARAYRRQALRHHPDRGGDLRRMQEINRAWQILRDPILRARYDAGEFGISEADAA